MPRALQHRGDRRTLLLHVALVFEPITNRPPLMKLASASLVLGFVLHASTAFAQSNQPSCSDDGPGRASRPVGRIDYGGYSYVAPAPATAVGFELDFTAGYWFIVTSRCNDWHLRLQPELGLDLSFVDPSGVDVRGRGGLAIGAASSFVQLSYVASFTGGNARGLLGVGLQHGPRLEVFFGVAGISFIHRYDPRTSGDVHAVGFLLTADLVGAISLLSGLGRWVR